MQIRALTRPGSSDAEEVRKMGISINVPEVLAVFSDISLWRIEDYFEGNVRELMYKAIYTARQSVTVRRAALCDCIDGID